ncbi:serine hydrolase domain-containing protein [Undibacterium flavidum]|uniref:Serine hydrolase n=1 Tax=Undibacterium flavidum TaxID=2762297 RepID=A0ABR6Y8I0_9BURK|nr:serine hydrolase [Undibacterium flavidum]MBC3872879.1 serine hydrolase [Undibacterium flavidum]
MKNQPGNPVVQTFANSTKDFRIVDAVRFKQLICSLSLIALVVAIPCGLQAKETQASSGKNTSTSTSASASYPHAQESIGTVRQIYDGVLSPAMAVNTFRNIDRLFPVNRIAKSGKPYPLPLATKPLTNVNFVDRGRHFSLEQYLELNQIAALLIIKDGKIQAERYRYGNTPKTRWMSMSIAKSITSTLIGAALRDGKIKSLNDPVIKYVPNLKSSAYQQASVRDVLMMSSGARWSEAYSDPRSDRRHLLEAQIAQVSGAAMKVMASLPQQAAAGTRFNYNTGETQVAAQLLRNALGQSLSSYLSERIWSRFGMEADAYWWLDSPNGVEIGGSGISANLRDYGRFGLFMLAGGLANKEMVLPVGWTYEATTPQTLRDGTLIPYGYLWWPVTSRAGLQDAAYSAIGIHGQYLYINPRQNLVIVVWGAQPQPSGGAMIDDQAFFAAVSAELSAK